MAIARDFNNILTASDLLLKSIRQKIYYKDTNHIRQNVTCAANLIKQLPTFSKKI